GGWAPARALRAPALGHRARRPRSRGGGGSGQRRRSDAAGSADAGTAGPRRSGTL
ncbi:MAG: hypothetical protein AVDCRST_MAG49-590, partial [uncultured Thermomicrobiales bacterium]